ncbi:hypothetical protein QRD89_08135 [Halobacillus sp. ACCC02827]|uniref:hypothetical protein n=1 Tax=Bacillaceae TaxID=186817 RepID=UPI0002A4DA41|nr:MULTISPECIES: hypothetical protein [Bacillaceae]ELK44975.1 hypothetical protein D479_16449 [Halobacillus sp. BAB-2008]QHT46490.1 hypothetical protein M662_08305 [Bacillus sp. SB49]WJE17303.1 hypothetical protein QRD89_08135 [Halobacillus sp. ACCC02827]
MQAKNLMGGQELLCINTEKVYDWIINEASFDLTLGDFDLPVGPTGDLLECTDIENVTCVVEPAEVDPIEIVGRTDQELVVDGTLLTLQLVNIRKNFTVTVLVELIPELGGGTIEVGSVDFTRCEQVLLCAPDGTDVDVSYTDLDCFICNFSCEENGSLEDTLTDVTVTVRLCQSIQSTYDVTLEIVADFCQPRDILPIPPCPAPTIPPQCPVLFPNVDDGPGLSGDKC